MPRPTLTPEQQDHMRQYIAALRSGEYVQTQSTLRRMDTIDSTARYCCLGVACDVYRKATGIGEFYLAGVQSGELYGFMIDERRYEGLIPVPVAEWLGIIGGRASGTYTANPVLVIPPALKAKRGMGITRDAAARLNDRDQMTLSEIADCFEYTYLTGEYGADIE